MIISDYSFYFLYYEIMDNRLSEQAIKEFQKLWYESTGEHLDYATATQMANKYMASFIRCFYFKEYGRYLKKLDD